MKKINLPIILTFIGLSLLFLTIYLNISNSNSDHVYMSDYEYEQSRPSTSIDVPTFFHPTLELTDEIRNTSLKDLIKQERGRMTEEQESRYEINLRNYDNQKYDKNDPDQKKSFEYWRPRLRHIFIKQEVQKNQGLNFSGVNLKSVDESSNLAKVFYLQDVVSFVIYNESYYNNIYEQIFNEEKKQNEKKAQENWGEYLNN